MPVLGVKMQRRLSAEGIVINARAAVRGPDAAAPRDDADDRRLLREVLAKYRRALVRA